MASNPPRLPVDLVTGFLGSGKSTLINAVLRHPDFTGAMVIVNEFGEVGLDHLLVSSADDHVLLLDSGCLCCAASGTLRDTLIDLFARRSSGRIAAFDRVIVETSGLAHPAPLVASLLGDSALAARCRLSQVVTLVDAAMGLDTLQRYVEARLQVAFADRLLVSKTDTADPERIAQLEQQLTKMNPRALLAHWQRGELPASHFTPPTEPATASALMSTVWMRGSLRPQYVDEACASDDYDDSGTDAADRHGSAFRRISSHVLQMPDALEWSCYAGFTQALSARLGKRLLRCKGLVALGEHSTPWVVQGVQGYFAPPERLDAWPPAVAQGFLVCIGESLTRHELDTIIRPWIPFQKDILYE